MFYCQLVQVLPARQVIFHCSFTAWHLHCVQAASGVWAPHQYVWLVASFSLHCES